MALTAGQKVVIGGIAIATLVGLGLALRAKAEVPTCTPDTIEVLEYCADGITPYRWRVCQADGTWMEVYLLIECPPTPTCAPDMVEVLEYCSDGVTPYRWRVCQADGTWLEESAECPTPPPICTEGKTQILDCCPGGVIPNKWRTCENGSWRYYLRPEGCQGQQPVPCI